MEIPRLTMFCHLTKFNLTWGIHIMYPIFQGTGRKFRHFKGHFYSHSTSKEVLRSTMHFILFPIIWECVTPSVAPNLTLFIGFIHQRFLCMEGISGCWAAKIPPSIHENPPLGASLLEALVIIINFCQITIDLWQFFMGFSRWEKNRGGYHCLPLHSNPRLPWWSSIHVPTLANRA